jgi:hypothetical protein
MSLHLLLVEQSPPRLGAALRDTAELSGLMSPTGTITFHLYGPDDYTCAGPPLYSSAPILVNGNGIYQSPPFTPTYPGVYRWTSNYSGDANNDPIEERTACSE